MYFRETTVLVKGMYFLQHMLEAWCLPHACKHAQVEMIGSYLTVTYWRVLILAVLQNSGFGGN